MKELRIGDRRICVSGNPDSGVPVCLIAGIEETQRLSEKLPCLRLIGIDGVDWNRELTPWPAEPVFRGKPGFGGGAGAFLAELRERILPAAENCGAPVTVRCIAGYSLAGLFALYAAACAPEFRRAASVSGSLWYENWTEFALNAAHCPERAYLSVGDRERLGGSAAFRRIEDCTRRTEEILRTRGAQTLYELNPGGHFDDPAGRMERALRWLTNTKAGEET